MARVIAVLAAVLGLCLGWSSASAAESSADTSVIGYTYDAPVDIAHGHDTVTERGPPTTSSSCPIDDSVAPWSCGAPERPDNGTTPAAYDYDRPSRLAQVARGSRVAERRDSGAGASSAVVDPWRVAANAAPKLAGVPKLAGGTLQDVGAPIWRHGNPASLLGTGSPEALRGLASRADAEKLRDFYQAAADAGRGGTTAPLRVRLAQEIIDAWD